MNEDVLPLEQDPEIRELIARALAEDVGSGDATTLAPGCAGTTLQYLTSARSSVSRQPGGNETSDGMVASLGVMPSASVAVVAVDRVGRVGASLQLPAKTKGARVTRQSKPVCAVTGRTVRLLAPGICHIRAGRASTFIESR